MFKSNVDIPGWLIIFLMIVSFITGSIFGFGALGSIREKYYVEGELQQRGITVFNNSGYWITISSIQIGYGELKNIGSPEELIDYSK